MKNKEIREMTDAELTAKVVDFKREKLNLKIQSRTGQLEKTARVREVRRDITRCLTEIAARKANAEVK
jgi:large subunit ribosomal protein L29